MGRPVTRERLPNRRVTVTETLMWGGNRVHVSAGLATDGRILECFVAGQSVGSNAITSSTTSRSCCPGSSNTATGSNRRRGDRTPARRRASIAYRRGR